MADPVSEGREGFVTVWGHDGSYAGCMGRETWQWLLDHPEVDVPALMLAYWDDISELRAALVVALEWIDMRCDKQEFPKCYDVILAALAERGEER